MDLALLYGYNCDREFSENLAFLPRADREFSDFGREKFTALLMTRKLKI